MSADVAACSARALKAGDARAQNGQPVNRQNSTTAFPSQVHVKKFSVGQDDANLVLH